MGRHGFTTCEWPLVHHARMLPLDHGQYPLQDKSLLTKNRRTSIPPIASHRIPSHPITSLLPPAPVFQLASYPPTVHSPWLGGVPSAQRPVPSQTWLSNNNIPASSSAPVSRSFSSSLFPFPRTIVKEL
ncbi:hypothetical protein SODALDRAFT_331825, partial [Sodiomyces alkalinus F11]